MPGASAGVAAAGVGAAGAETPTPEAAARCERWLKAVTALPGEPPPLEPGSVVMRSHAGAKVTARCIPSRGGYWYVALLPGYAPDNFNQYHADTKLYAGWKPSLEPTDLPDNDFRMAPGFLGPQGYFHSRSTTLRGAEVVDVDQDGPDDLVVSLGDAKVILRTNKAGTMAWYPGSHGPDEPTIDVITAVNTREGRVSSIVGTSAINWCDDGGEPWYPPPVVLQPGATPGAFVMDRPASDKARRALCGDSAPTKLVYPSSSERTRDAFFCAMALGAPQTIIDAAFEQVSQTQGCDSVGDALEKFATMWLYKG